VTVALTVLLHCKDLDETRAFYSAVLGFSVIAATDETLTVEKSGARLVFTSQNLWNRNPSCSGTFYFAVPDVAGYYAAVKDRAAISWPLQETAYGSREFGLDDCNGYCLAFQQAG
jgi:catechol 2,3-dioxygenase-like lactoylglutathione lyase family enzyme